MSFGAADTQPHQGSFCNKPLGKPVRAPRACTHRNSLLCTASQEPLGGFGVQGLERNFWVGAALAGLRLLRRASSGHYDASRTPALTLRGGGAAAPARRVPGWNCPTQTRSAVCAGKRLLVWDAGMDSQSGRERTPRFTDPFLPAATAAGSRRDGPRRIGRLRVGARPASTPIPG